MLRHSVSAILRTYARNVMLRNRAPQRGGGRGRRDMRAARAHSHFLCKGYKVHDIYVIRDDKRNVTFYCKFNSNASR